MPIGEETPQIGLFDFEFLENVTINNLFFDGNKDATLDSSIGTQSLIRIDDSSNVVFKNITIENTHQVGINGDKNLLIFFCKY